MSSVYTDKIIHNLNTACACLIHGFLGVLGTILLAIGALTGPERLTSVLWSLAGVIGILSIICFLVAANFVMTSLAYAKKEPENTDELSRSLS